MTKITQKTRKTIQFLNRNDGSLKHKVLRAGFWVFLSSYLLNVFSFLKNIILARLLFPEIFGLMGICFMVIRGVELFTETGFGTALIHRQNKYEEAKETAFTLIVIRGFILTSFIYFISPFVANYYEKNELNTLIKALALTILFNSFANININTQEKNLDFKKITLLRQTSSIIDFTIVIVLAYFLRSVWALVIGQIIMSIFNTFFSYFFIPGRLKFKFDPKIAKSLFGYGKYVTGITIVLYIASEIDNAFIGKLLGMDMLGFYVIAYSLANLPATHISKVASRIMFPAYCSIQNNLEKLHDVYLKVFNLLSKITIPAAFGLAILAPEIISIVYGEKWMPAVSSLQILCVFGGCRSLIATNGYLFNALGKPYFTFYIATVRLFIISLIIYPLTKKYGLVGASLSVTLPIILELLMSSVIISNILKIKIYLILKIVLFNIFQATIMATIILLIKLNIIINNFMMLFFIIIFGILIYSLINFQYIISITRRNY
jgi:PST family polysaccharide transporter